MKIGNRPVYWDLDGVLRDLTTGISDHIHEPFEPLTWNENVRRGVSLCDYIDRNPVILATAPPTAFLPLAASEDEPIILTVQPLHWIPWTRLWLREHLPNASVRWCQRPEENLGILARDGALIVEDYPYFPDNERIIMVDYLYNCMVKGVFARIHGIDDLLKMADPV